MDGWKEENWEGGRGGGREGGMVRSREGVALPHGPCRNPRRGVDRKDPFGRRENCGRSSRGSLRGRGGGIEGVRWRWM